LRVRRNLGGGFYGPALGVNISGDLLTLADEVIE
jgi:hypothetical protein